VTCRFFRVPLEQIGYVRAILEGYDGIATVSSADPDRGEIEIAIGDGLDEEADAVLTRLGREAGLIEIARPDGWRSRA
jgi:hypothetical protein